jgi:two-component system, chemotaxis family, CheB/CheR fusion protein
MTTESPSPISDSSDTKQAEEVPNADDRKAIVGVGASAGGLEAFTQLLRALPIDTGFAFVLIQHLDPAHESQLSEILSRATTMPVMEAEEGMAIASNCIYVIPPNTLMTLERGILKLEPRQRIRGRYMAIDGFFSSLARDWGERAIAVVLSGSNEDGTEGLREIKSAGGFTFAQDLESAEFPTMPQSAIDSGNVDFVLPPAEIAAKLLEISRHVRVMDATDDIDMSAEPPEAVDLDSALTLDPLLNGDIKILQQIFALLQISMRVDFSLYKQGTIRRRIWRRMVQNNLERLDDYLHYLQTHPAEVQQLYQDILINVTSFFREPDSFEALKRDVFPTICQDKSNDLPIRIWVAGCSTGEEPYSIAMSLLEFLGDLVHKQTIQIFATDINETAIEKARLGIYTQNLVANVSPERLRRFFIPIEGGYQIGKTVRELCVFAHQNLTSDPPFSRLDLVSCRNMLIYLEPVLQKKVMPMFHYALNTNGFLMLGSSESVGEFSDLFAIADKKNRIYTRKSTLHRMNFNFISSNYASKSFNPSRAEDVSADLDLEQIADRLVLHQYAPVGAIINAEMEILQFRGQTAPYLEPAPGKASLNLLKMVRSGLALDLQTAIHQAKQQNIPIRTEGIQIKEGEEWRTVNLDVIPLNPLAPGDRYFLVLFKDIPNPDISNLIAASRPPAKSRKVRQTEAELEVTRLTQELAKTQAYLQTIIENQESINQDLKVANEEILSSNEELQSTNEELETAKEEIQATNEELITINEELRSRNLQLNQVNNDMLNLLGSVNIPILMLSGDLQIRRFTPMAETLFNLIPTDVGRPFSDIQPNFHIPNLGELIASVIDNLVIHEQDVQDVSGRWYSLRIRPYKTNKNQIDGAVISAIDINSLKRSLIQLESTRNYATAIVETLRQPLVILNSNLQVISANRAFYQVFQLSPAQTELLSIFDLGEGAWNIPSLRSLLDQILTTNISVQDFEVEQDFTNLGHRTMLLNACQIDLVDMGQMILLAIEDITVRKQQSQLLVSQNQSLSQAIAVADAASLAKTQFLSNMSHELRTPLTSILGFSRLLQVVENTETETEEYLEIIYQSGEHLLSLIEDLLDISKIEAEKKEINASTIPFANFLRTTVDLIRFRADKKKIAFVSRFAADLPQVIYTDERRLKQVLLNLLSNAIKFTFVGAITFSVSKVRSDSPDHQSETILFTIKDTGVGIEAEDLEKIFLPFEQVGNLRANAQGTGLGLAISQEIVEMLGSKIGVTSKFGEGSVFSFELTVAIASPPAQLSDQISDESDLILMQDSIENIDLAAELPLRILLAEDVIHNQILVAAFFKKLGYAIDVASDGLEVLERVRTKTYDVIFMDIQMPKMDGMEATRQLLAEWGSSPRPYIIAMTADAMPSHRKKFTDIGMDDYISKPIYFDTLVRAIRRIGLNRPKAIE